MRRIGIAAGLAAVAMLLGTRGAAADDDDWRWDRGRDRYEERLKADEKYWKEIRKAEEKRREQMLKAEQERWKEARRARDRERELAELAQQRARERQARSWAPGYWENSDGRRRSYDDGVGYGARSYSRSRGALDRYDYLPPPPPQAAYEEWRSYPPPATYSGRSDYGPAYYGPEPRYAPPADAYYGDRYVEYYEPYDPYASRGADAGASIGARIGSLIGGPEGAAIGAGIGRDIGAEVERR